MDGDEQGRNKPEILRAIWALGVKKKLRARSFFSGPDLFFLYLYTSGVDMNQHIQGQFGPLVRTFCGPHQIWRAIIGPPYFNHWR